MCIPMSMYLYAMLLLSLHLYSVLRFSNRAEQHQLVMIYSICSLLNSHSISRACYMALTHCVAVVAK